PSARAAPPPPPPSAPKRVHRRKAPAARKPNTPPPTAAESVTELGAESDGLEEVPGEPEEPEQSPDHVHFQCTVLLDGTHIKAFGKTWDINSMAQIRYLLFDHIAKGYIESYMEKRGGRCTSTKALG